MTILGRPIIILPYDKPGCWDRIQGFLLTWARRLLWVGVGVTIGVIFE